MHITFSFLLVVVLFLFSSIARGTPLTVIYDSGDTLPTKPYIKIQSKNKKSTILAKAPISAVRYPITTPSMQPGTFKSRNFKIPHFQTPLFIIGNDELSRQWLVSRADILRKLGAMGLLVEVQSADAASAVRSIAKGLRIDVVSGEDIAKQLNLYRYPVLISKLGIEQ